MQIFNDKQRKNTENELEEMYKKRLETIGEKTKGFSEERRYKRLIIDMDYIFNFFVKQNHHEFLLMPQIEGIPNDAIIKRVDYDIQSDGFSFLIYHPSFEIVPQYASCPIINIEQIETFVKSDYKKKGDNYVEEKSSTNSGRTQAKKMVVSDGQ